MAYDDYAFYGFRPCVSVGSRRAVAARELAKLKKTGRTVAPVVIEGRKIARTFWGQAWCDNLERYSDFANRLPRGRTYVRNGSGVDLQLQPGRVTALVSGSAMYEVNVTVGPVPRARWSAICQDCSGAIESRIEPLHERFSNGVMTRLCDERNGLFPSPKARVLAADDLSEMFGLDMAPPAPPAQAPARAVPTRHSTAFTTAAVSTPTVRTPPAKSKTPARKGERQPLTSKKRHEIGERMRKYWAERRARTRTRKAAKP